MSAIINGIKGIVSFISMLASFISQFISSLLRFIKIIIDLPATVTALGAYVPQIIMTGIIFTVSIFVLKLVIGRN